MQSTICNIFLSWYFNKFEAKLEASRSAGKILFELIKFRIEQVRPHGSVVRRVLGPSTILSILIKLA